MKYVKAERVSSDDFWTLDEEGQLVTILRGRDFVVWSLPQRAVCDCRRDYRMAVQLGPNASGTYDVWFTNTAAIGPGHYGYSAKRARTLSTGVSPPQ